MVVAIMNIIARVSEQLQCTSSCLVMGTAGSSAMSTHIQYAAWDHN
jgi:hypothetical protein